MPYCQPRHGRQVRKDTAGDAAENWKSLFIHLLETVDFPLGNAQSVGDRFPSCHPKFFLKILNVYKIFCKNVRSILSFSAKNDVNMAFFKRKKKDTLFFFNILKIK